MSFTRPDLIVDASVIAENAKAKLEESLPGWSAEADPVTSAILDALAEPAAEQAQALELDLIDAFKGIGSLHGVNPIPAVPAIATGTFTLSSAAPVGGYTIPAGSLVGIRDPNFDLQGFRLTSELTVLSGATTASGTLEATTPGVEANNLSGTAVLIDVPAAVLSVTLGTSGGGEEEEEEAAYLDRLTEDLELLSIAAIRAADAAGVARKTAGVGRATGVDLLKPAAGDGGEGSEETNVERCVTVAVTNEEGQPTTSGVRSTVLAELLERATANMRYFVISPHYEPIDVTATVFAWPGQEAAQVKAEVAAALKRMLSPATAQTGPSGNPARWANDPVLRAGEFFAAISGAAGVRWASGITFGKHGGALSAADYTMSAASKVPVLPEPGTITVTVEPTS